LHLNYDAAQQRHMPIVRFTRLFARTVALVLFAAVIARAASAQTDATAAPLASAASKIAKAASQSKARKLVVLDFVYFDSPPWDALGQKLAADLRSQIAALPNAPSQEDHSKLIELMQKHKFTQGDLTYSAAAAEMLSDSDVNAWAIADLEPHGDTIEATFSVYAFRKPGKPPAEIATFTTKIPFTAELKAMVPPLPYNPFPGYPVAGRDGMGMPGVLSSQAPDVPPAARKGRVRGTVVLVAVIEANGDLGAVEVVRGAPFGLTDAAIACVHRWKFEPARGKDGKPVAVVQTIEIAFNL
jgi:TonB family protein